MFWIINSCAIIILVMRTTEVLGLTDIPLADVEKFSDRFGRSIRQFFIETTAINRIEKKFEESNATIHIKDGNSMILEFARDVTNMLSQKHEALQRLVSVAEESNANHEFNDSMTLDYPRAKHMSTDFLLTPNERFDFTPVNTSLSSVHVPTDIYDQSTEVLNGVSWSNVLDDVFKSNLESDPTIGWQYFSSSVGFFRIFPGMAWPVPTDGNGVDFFDSRTRPWYILAATSPKDVIILVDGSGSMTGQKMTIARMTIAAVLDTLSDDDFFNVIIYQEQAFYANDCFNRTLLQANGDNKQRIKKRLVNVRPKGIAYLEYGLIESFEVLHRTDEIREGALCNKAIIIISDEVSKTYEEIFNQYNHPITDVRIFIYLIGREVVDINPSRSIVCSNKGYFSNIATSADINENVQRYIGVMARPMVLSSPTIARWTSAYLASNEATDQGLQMITTLSQSVFDTRPEFNTSGNLLGVIGTDVPTSAITSLMQPYKLGVNGYSFAITNNGYIVFHPDFRPLDGAKAKPSYNSVLLTEVELSEDAAELEEKMVNRETGNLTMTTMIHYDQMRRLTIRSNHYYFAPINGTPFSLGIALPDDYGSTWLDGKIHLEKADLSILEKEDLIIASWNYCWNMKPKGNESRLGVLLKILKQSRDQATINELCDVKLIERLMFDAEVTLDMVSWWKESVESRNLSEKVRSIFIGTRTGLTRYWKKMKNSTTDFPPQKTTSVTEMYYTTAVDNGRNVLTASSALKPDRGQQVTLSSPVVVAKDNLTTMAAVVGVQIQRELFNSIFNSATYCDTTNQTGCTLSCSNKTVDCYLLDNNGYILLSKQDNEIGRFFGEVDPTIMNHLQDEKKNSKLIYKQVVLYDYQDVCLVYTDEVTNDSPSFRLRILSQLFAFLCSVACAVFQLINQLTSFHWWLNSLSTFWIQPPSVTSAESDSEPVMCDRALNMFYAPHLSETTAPSGNGSIDGCTGGCKKSFAFSHVPLTNMFLVVSDATCICSRDTPILTDRPPPNLNDTTVCEKLRKNSHRRRPEYCFSSHPLEKPGSCDANGKFCSLRTLRMIFASFFVLTLLQ